MARVEGLTIKITAEMDDDVKALCRGYKQIIADLEAENEHLRELLDEAATEYFMSRVLKKD